MKYKVSGRSPIATSKGDVVPGGTFDAKDLPEYVAVDALLAAGHIEPADEKKPADDKAGASK